MRTNIFGTSVFTQLPDGVLYTNMPDKCKQLYALLCKKSKLKKNDNYDIQIISIYEDCNNDWLAGDPCNNNPLGVKHKFKELEIEYLIA